MTSGAKEIFFSANVWIYDYVLPNSVIYQEIWMRKLETLAAIFVWAVALDSPPDSYSTCRMHKRTISDYLKLHITSVCVSKLSKSRTMFGCLSPRMISISLFRLRSSFSERPTLGMNFKATTWKNPLVRLLSFFCLKWPVCFVYII